MPQHTFDVRGNGLARKPHCRKDLQSSHRRGVVAVRQRAAELAASPHRQGIGKGAARGLLIYSFGFLGFQGRLLVQHLDFNFLQR